MVNAFEREFAKKVGIPNAVAVASGTAAMPWWNSFTSVKLASHFTG
jgi:dTDP-4-amino-4,6-dideoxygalactose transaminase